MAPALFRKIIDELADIDFKGSLSPHLYGEPLTDSRLISFMHYARARLPNARLEIYTNGDFLTPTLLDELYAAGVRDFLISVHSTDDPSLTESVNRVLQLREHAKNQNMNINLPYQSRIGEGPLSNRGGLVEVNKLERSPRCLEGDEPVTINYRGDVIICMNDYHGQVIFGNLCDESLEDIWSKPKFVKIRRQIESGVYQLDICKKCTQERTYLLRRKTS
jgi:radical SAM protein with 4Fe4S-binding SPASM domain